MARGVVNTPRLDPEPNSEQKLLKNNRKQAGKEQQEILSKVPGFENLKAYISSVLSGNNAEAVLTSLVDKILKEEQMALTEETKEEARIKKVLLGRALSEVVAYGDQQGLLYLLTDRLGYRKH